MRKKCNFLTTETTFEHDCLVHRSFYPLDRQLVPLALLVADTVHGSMVASGNNGTNGKLTNGTTGGIPNVASGSGSGFVPLTKEKKDRFSPCGK